MVPELTVMCFLERGQQESDSGKAFPSNRILLPSKREMQYSIPLSFMCSGRLLKKWYSEKNS